MTSMDTIPKFAGFFNESEFVRKLVIAATPIYGKHMKESLDENFSIPLESIGTEKEKHIKSIMDVVGTLSSYFDDLENVLKYLRVDKTKISALYGNSLDAEEYYKYHYDNFAVRLMTSIDICGKIGIAIYKLKIDERSANGYSFAKSSLIKDTEQANKIFELSDFLESFAQHRHSKIHQGKSIDNRFDKIVFWESIGKNIGDPTLNDPVLDKYNRGEILEAVRGIEEVISQTAILVIAFLDSMESKLDEILMINA